VSLSLCVIEVFTFIQSDHCVIPVHLTVCEQLIVRADRLSQIVVEDGVVYKQVLVEIPDFNLFISNQPEINNLKQHTKINIGNKTHVVHTCSHM
jgi:hypothetical protein